MTAEETAAKIISKVGLWWPLAEEDQLRTAAGAYEQCAKAVRAAAATGTAGATLVTGSPNKGEAIDAFAKHWGQYDGDCNAGLPATAQAADNVAKALRDFADAVDDAKRKIINLAIEIGATIAVGVGLALFTFGGSAAAAATRTAMLVARGWLIAHGLTGVIGGIVATALVGAAFGAVEGFITGIVAQVAKTVLSDGDGISLSETMSWTAGGAAGGGLFAGGGAALRSGMTAMRASDNILASRLANTFGGKARPVPIGGPKDFDPQSLRGLSPDSVRASIPPNWTPGSSKAGGGEKFMDPVNLGRQIRIMPGYTPGSRPDPLTWGPYAVVSQNGPPIKIPLAGNPTLSVLEDAAALGGGSLGSLGGGRADR